MKKYILSLILMVFTLVAVVAETKIAVTQSIRYGNGDFAPLDTPEISLKKVFNDGGKVFFKYDFEITDRDSGDADDIYIAISFPEEYRYFIKNKSLRVTTVSGATDVIADVIEQYDKPLIKREQYKKQLNELKDSIERVPRLATWYVNPAMQTWSRYKYKYSFFGFLLKM